MCKSKIRKEYSNFSIPINGEIKVLENIKQYKCTNPECNKVYIDSEISVEIDKKVSKFSN